MLRAVRRARRPDVCAVEDRESLERKLVVAARVHCREPAMDARERERMIAHRADVVLGLPDAATLDARPCVQRLDDAPTEEVPCDRGRGNEDASLRPAANLGLVRSRLAEEKLESWPRGA